MIVVCLYQRMPQVAVRRILHTVHRLQVWIYHIATLCHSHQIVKQESLILQRSKISAHGIVFLYVLHLKHVIRSIATQSHFRATADRHLWHKYIVR